MTKTEELKNAFDNVDKASGLVAMNRAQHAMLMQSLELIKTALFGDENAKAPSGNIPSPHSEGGDIGRSNDAPTLSKRGPRSGSLQS